MYFSSGAGNLSHVRRTIIAPRHRPPFSCNLIVNLMAFRDYWISLPCRSVRSMIFRGLFFFPHSYFRSSTPTYTNRREGFTVIFTVSKYPRRFPPIKFSFLISRFDWRWKVNRNRGAGCVRISRDRLRFVPTTRIIPDSDYLRMNAYTRTTFWYHEWQLQTICISHVTTRLNIRVRIKPTVNCTV